MKYFKLFLLLIVLALFYQQASATIIHVPGDSSTIQGAVNGAGNGDTILVAPGTYYENVSCTCKAVLLASHYLFDHDTLTIDSTIIDGGGETALWWEGWDCFPENGRLTVIGFTIRNSFYGVWKFLEWWFDEPKAQSRICHNKFMDNYCGVFNLTYDTCVIDSNLFINNQVGVECYGNVSKYEKGLLPPTCTTIVENNVFLFNSEVGAIAWGGALQIFRNNIFSRNAWGIVATYYSGIKAVRNVICNNSVGVYCETMEYWEDPWAIIENNIIAKNDTGIYVRFAIRDTIIRYNDVWDNLGGDFIGCPAGTGDTTWGTNFNKTPCDSFYNIMRDPLFADTIDFELLCNSPCIDAGDSSVQVSDSGGCRPDIGKNEFHYIIGDANGDSGIDIADAVFIVNYLFIGGPSPCPHHSGDTNCDGTIDISDIVCLVNYLFCGYPIPCF